MKMNKETALKFFDEIFNVAVNYVAPDLANNVIIQVRDYLYENNVVQPDEKFDFEHAFGSWNNLPSWEEIDAESGGGQLHRFKEVKDENKKHKTA